MCLLFKEFLTFSSTMEQFFMSRPTILFVSCTRMHMHVHVGGATHSPANGITLIY